MTSNKNKVFPFQLDEFYLDLQKDGSKISLLQQEEINKMPFPGLRPFKTSEFQLFKGRDGQAEELIKRLKNNHFLAVIGSSGTGKSSLIRAGLIPQLFGGYLHDAGNKWNIAICRPGKNPIENLGISLSSIKSHSKEKDRILDAYEVIHPLLNRSAYGLLEVNEHLNEAAEVPANLLIIIDQFEELFRFNRADLGIENIENQFINLLLKAASNPGSSVYIIVTMRSEFLGDCVKYRGLPEAINQGQYLVPQLTRNQLIEVIEGPINLAGRKISQGLVELLINEIEETKLKENLDQLPILQHALMRTYNKATTEDTTEEISYEHYKAIGGMENALANHAEVKFEELDRNNTNPSSSKKQKIAKIVFQSLTDLSKDQKGGRRPTELSNIYKIAKALNATEEEVDEVINHFRQDESSFIMPPNNTNLYPNLILDISHESLMRNWARLNEWIKEELQNAKLYTTLNERRELSENGKEEWLRGGLLEDILRWKDYYPHNAAWASRYYSTINAFDLDVTDIYDKNIAFLNKSKQEAENIKTKREDDIKRDQRDIARKKIIWLFIVSTIVSCALAIWGFSSMAIARNNEKYAKSSAKEAKQSAWEATKQRRLAESNANAARQSANDAKKQKELAQINEKEAEKQKLVAQTQANIANLLKKEALALVDETNNYRKIAELQERRADTQRLIAQKETFENKLNNKAWWKMGTLNEDLKNKIRDTLFNLRYHWLSDNSHNEDTLLANRLEHSFELMNLAESVKSKDWALYLNFLKRAKDYDNNFVTKKIFDSLLKITLPFEEKYFVPPSTTNYTKNELYKVVLLPNNDIIAATTEGVFSFNKSHSDPKQLLHLVIGITPIALSKDAKYLLALDQRDNLKNKYIIYDIKSGNNEGNFLTVFIDENYNKYLNAKYTQNKTLLKASFSVDNSLVAMYKNDDSILYIYNINKKYTEKIVISQHENIHNIDFSQNSNKVLISYDDSIVVLNTDDKKRNIIVIKNSMAHRDKNNELSSENIIKAGFTASESVVWGITSASNKYDWQIISGNNYSIINKIRIGEENIIVSPLNNYYIAVDYPFSQNIYYKNFDTNIIDKIFPWHYNDIKDAYISKDGHSIVSADNNYIYLWKNDINSHIKDDGIKKYEDTNIAFSYYKDIGDEYFDSKKYDSAMRYYKDAISYKYDKNLLSNYVRSLYMLNSFDSAMSIAKKMTLIDSNDGNANNQIGNIYYSLKKYDTAIQYYKKSVKLLPNDIVIFDNLIQASNKLRMYDSSMIYINKIIVNDTGNQSLLFDRFIVNFNLHKYKKAINDLRSIYNSAPNDSNVLAFLGFAYCVYNNYDSAEKYIDKALAADSLDISLWEVKSYMCLDRKNYNFAYKYMLKQKRIDSLNADVWDDLSAYFLQKSNFDSAIEMVNKAIKIDSTLSYAYARKGFSKLKTGKIYDGLFYLNKAINCDSTDYRSYLYFSAYYAFTNDIDRSIYNFENACRKYNDGENISNILIFLDDEEWFNSIRSTEVYRRLYREIKERRDLLLKISNE